MKTYRILLCIIFFVSTTATAQQIKQTIRGRVIDTDMKFPLAGVSIHVFSPTDTLFGASDDNGYYQIDNVPVGRATLRFQSLGYRDITIPDVLVHSGKEVVMNIEMQETLEIVDEVVIEGQAREKGQPKNDMASVSVRSFNVNETKRYPASRDDIARMVENFAGVRGADDARNDIIIRGNSPTGVLWRLEGLDIPNPNHFAVFGTTGGPVNVLNNKVLGNSDFFTGAFPSEYGNAIGGVFDVRMRNGNYEKREHTFQLGFLGIEGVSEGPISRKNNSSYIFSYRYATLAMMDRMGFNFGAAGAPSYQDASLKLNFPLKNGDNLSVFAVGGISDISIIEEDRDTTQWSFGRAGRDIHFGSRMGVAGISYRKNFNKTTYSQMTIGVTNHTMYSRYDTLGAEVISPGDTMDVKGRQYTADFSTSRATMSWFVHKKLTPRHHIKGGVFADYFFFNMQDVYWKRRLNNYQLETFADETTALFQPYIQYKFVATERLIFNVGLHYQHFTLNANSRALEPRAGMRWNFADNQALSAGIGLHSQMQPQYLYFQLDTAQNHHVQHNRHIGFTRSQHYVLGYDRRIGKTLKFRTEVYYQYLFNVPVEQFRMSSYSAVNLGGGFNFARPRTLVNTGTGENYGIEFTAERFFNRGYYFLTTLSLYESTYRGSDGVRRQSEFSGNYTFNSLGGYEFKLGEKKNTILGISGRVVLAGGRRYTPIDEPLSAIEGQAMFQEDEAYTLQYPEYRRIDVRISLRKSLKKFSHELSLDLINVTNRANVLTQTYDPARNQVIFETQLGFLPLLNYIIDF
ncbi:MAG: TonB-dependent receptor [Cytophagaceae bacterium]